MNKNFNLQILVFILFSVPGCVGTTNYTGFLDGSRGVTPIAKKYEGNTPAISIEHPEDTVVIVYSHGTFRPQRYEDCSKRWNQVPSSILELQDKNTRIYYLCSRATEPGSTKHVGQYIFKRVSEVENVLDELRGLGVPASNMFLAGHSAGGWTSLMSSKIIGDKFNASIVFAPAFAGKRSETSRYPWWRKEARPKQIVEMLKSQRIEALVFAYKGDAFNRPIDLEFLTKAYPNSIEMISYGCALSNNHLTHIYDCRESETIEKMRNYIEKRLHRASSESHFQ